MTAYQSTPTETTIPVEVQERDGKFDYYRPTAAEVYVSREKGRIDLSLFQGYSDSEDDEFVTLSLSRVEAYEVMSALIAQLSKSYQEEVRSCG